MADVFTKEDVFIKVDAEGRMSFSLNPSIEDTTYCFDPYAMEAFNSALDYCSDNEDDEPKAEESYDLDDFLESYPDTPVWSGQEDPVKKVGE